MKLVLSPLLLSSLLFSCLGLTSCQLNQVIKPDPQITLTAIADITSQPTIGVTSVYVRGTVGDRAPLLKQTAYQLQDNTGQIWVITNHSPPESGQTLTIQAKIKSKSIVLQQQQSEEVYLEEMEQLPQDFNPKLRFKS